MAQSVLAAIPAYAMQTAVLPVKTCEEIDKRIRNFVWGSTVEERKICLVAWDKVCLPKEKEGLGLRLARQLNRAFLTKLAFTFFKEKDKLWVRVLQHKYFSQNVDGLASRNLKSMSPLWKGMSHEWGTMLAGAKSAIRDGTETLFWTNNWVDSNIRLLDFAISSDPAFDIDCTVASLVDAAGQWDFNRLQRILAPEAVDVVAGMSPPQENRGPDDWVWGLEKSGVFSIKSAYNLICEIDSIPSSNLWKVVWGWIGPSRIKHFLWLAAKDKLLTNEGRCRRGLSTDDNCGWCGMATESIVHVLRDCSFARDTWRAVGGFDTEGLEWNRETSEWLQLFLAGEKDLRFGIVCWYLWRSRNERLFAGKAAAGGLLRDREGNCIQAYALNLGACSITRAEIRGALEGIRRAWSEGFRSVEAQLDSQAAIAILSDRSPNIDHQHALEALEFRDWLNRD
ncbi:Putative ribonuclease H protein At1g65750 [Linum perenne]